ncbi:MAG: HPr(Ser) kinase/phosphatase [Oscillospiraceae bacterium]
MSQIKYKVCMKKIIDEFNLNTIYTPCDVSELFVESPEIIRPGLMLAGYINVFDSKRVQILGTLEMSYLEQLPTDLIQERVNGLFAIKPPLVVVARNLDIPPSIVLAAKEFGVPLFTSGDNTASLVAAMFAFLNLELAPRTTQHGVLVEVYGEGILLMGESGVGKSETAIELIKRGHRLIADDAVEIRRVSNKTLVGSSPENIRHFLELRGIGIINARRIFGMGSVKVTEKIDLIICLEQWDPNKMYDRMGIENEYKEILGINVTSLTIPVKPGRNLAIIIEVAAMNNRQKKMGYNAAEELLKNLSMTDNQTGDINFDQY